ncbi:hypothetical protein ACF0H5_005802 [Mactra antiquata]
MPINFLCYKSRNTAPGYTLLKLISLQEADYSMRFYRCLVDIDGKLSLSSDDLKQCLKELFIRTSHWPRKNGKFAMSRDNQGPSCQMESLNGQQSEDVVAAIPCDCPRLISAWRNRPRPYDWPSRELINNVSSLKAHAVPVGYKGSPLHFLEWRIYFTLGEIRLIEHLNECQIKLIILLKMIAQEELKPICREMSSYVMKNIVLWLAESFPSALFQERNIIKLLINSLKVLKQCIRNRKFPSYMIESRNLFADRISDIEALQLCQKIDTCLCQGPKMLLKCKKIRDGLALFRTQPGVFNQLSECRQLLLTFYHQLLTLQAQELVRLNGYPACENLQLRPAFEKIDQTSSVEDIAAIIEDIILLDLDSLLFREVDIDQIRMRRVEYMLS